MHNLSYEQVTLKDGFFKKKVDLVRDVTIYSVFDRFDETGRVGAFACRYTPDNKDGLPMPHVFWDSDVAKWIESVAYLRKVQINPLLESKVDAIADEIERNRDENGYFNSHYLTVEQENRFSDRSKHELYCAGHLLEAAIAYKRATGKDKLYRLMKDYIDYIDRVFRVEGSAAFVTPGHEEIELALIKLYRESGEEKYLDLAMFFLDERGGDKEKHLFSDERAASYTQSHLPVRAQNTAEGHAVRLCYLFTAAAEAAYLRKDNELKEAAEAVFRNIVERRMYVTGGIGSTCVGEAFEDDYLLPNETAYCETCASIGLMLYAHRMQLLSDDSIYADVIERELYNGMLAGLSLDGKSFFYENPLKIALDHHSRAFSGKMRIHFPITERVEVFGCSCCPPNLTRIIPSVGNYIATVDGSTVRLHQYIASSIDLGDATLALNTNYPADGEIKVTLRGGAKQIGLRIPSWCESFDADKNGEVRNGYLYVTLADGESVTLRLSMTVRFVEASPFVRENAGKIAVSYGPIVYCAEAAHNPTALIGGAKLDDIRISTDAITYVHPDETYGLPVVFMTAYRREIPFTSAPLYSYAPTPLEPVPLQLIPYACYANAGSSDMQVWFLKA